MKDHANTCLSRKLSLRFQFISPRKSPILGDGSRKSKSKCNLEIIAAMRFLGFVAFLVFIWDSRGRVQFPLEAQLPEKIAWKYDWLVLLGKKQTQLFININQKQKHRMESSLAFYYFKRYSIEYTILLKWKIIGNSTPKLKFWIYSSTFKSSFSWRNFSCFKVIYKSLLGLVALLGINLSKIETTKSKF